jgi:hypothetical protein
MGDEDFDTIRENTTLGAHHNTDHDETTTTGGLKTAGPLTLNIENIKLNLKF